jgi:hypothetical protein
MFLATSDGYKQVPAASIGSAAMAVDFDHDGLPDLLFVECNFSDIGSVLAYHNEGAGSSTGLI